MSAILIKLKPCSHASRALRPALVGAARTTTLPGFWTRGISSGPKEDGDLGGPGGSEGPQARIHQNRRLAVMTGGAVLAIVAGYSMMTGRADKVVPARSAEEVLNKKQNQTPADKGLRAFRSD